MKGFLLFLLIVLAVYLSVNAYIYHHLFRAIHLTGWRIWSLRGLVLLVMLAYPVNRILGAVGIPTDFLGRIGAFWLGAMAYGLLLGVFVDLLRLSNLLLHWFPQRLRGDPAADHIMVSAGVLFVLILVVFGHIRSRHPLVHEYEVTLSGYPENRPALRLAMISDLHIGAIISPDRLETMIDTLLETRPDVVVVDGDLVDEPSANLEGHLPQLRRITAPLGVFVITGNHEYYNGVEGAIHLMERAGMTVLRDSVAHIADSFTLVGIDDRPARKQMRLESRPLGEILDEAPSDLPVVLLHHTPVMMDQVEDRVDLMLSGHTHNGQLWPFGLGAKLSYGIASGWKRYGERMQLYVSNGIGTWGPPLRVGAPPEVAVFVLKGET